MDKIIKLTKLISDSLKRERHHIAIKPLNALGFLTYRCTSRCKTCTIWKRDKGGIAEINREEWLEVLSQLKSSGIESLEIFGGDALLRKDAIFDVICFCANNGIYTHFPTNGNLCDQETVKRLIQAGLFTIYLSLDDLGTEHDRIRGVARTFLRVKSALETFIKFRGTAIYPKIIVCTTISNINYRNFQRVVEFLENYKIDAIYPRIVGEFSRENIESSTIDGYFPEPDYVSSEDSSHLFSNKELDELKKIISEVKRRDYKTYIDYRAFDVAKDKAFLSGEYDFKKCHIATTLVTINPNGDIVPCPFFRSYIIGNLTKNNLNEIWGNSLHKRFIRLQQKRKIAICKNCNLRVYYPSMLETLRWKWQKVIVGIHSTYMRQ